MSEDFPRLNARTRRFSVGAPRNFTISPDGTRVTFLRAKNGTDAAQSLWELDVASGVERLIVDAAKLDTGAEVPAHIRQMQERQRSLATGIIDYSADDALRTVAFSASGQLWRADIATGSLTAVADQAVNPRLSPAGDKLSYVRDGSLRVIGADGTDKMMAGEDDPDVTYGLPDFNAAEDMRQDTGHWWSPAGDQLLVARVDNSNLSLRYLPTGADPNTAPIPQRYPLAGQANPIISLRVVNLDGGSVPVDWDLAADDYLITAAWSRHGLAAAVLDRAQTTLRVLGIDPATGATRTLLTETDPAWVLPIHGVPDFTAAGELVWARRQEGAYRLVVNGEAVTGADTQVREVSGIDGETILFRASQGAGTETHLWTWSRQDGARRVTTAPGVYFGSLRGGTRVTWAAPLHGTERHTVHRGDEEVEVASHVEFPSVTPRVTFLLEDQPALRIAVLLPRDFTRGSGKLPVLMDPYGGPASQRVVAAGRRLWEPQWWADQGFAVVIVDGRGTPGLGPDWDRTIHLRKVDITVEDQVAGLHAAAEEFGELDLSRVGIRGWSYGGTLSVAALLRRPDVFHAGAAGASSLEPLLYSTYFTERYLSHPAEHPEVYQADSLIGDAHQLEGALLLIHGLADDNVHPANTMRMSQALLAAGKQHETLLLPGVTHMPAEPAAAENLLWHELRFMKRALRVA